MSQKKKYWVILVSLIAVILIIGITIGYCLGNGKSSNSEKSKNQTMKEDTYMTINTKYGDLYYPEQWTDYVVTKENWDEESLIISFAACINEDEYPMFQVTIGDSHDTKVGEITDSKGVKRNVYLKLEEIKKSEKLNDGEQKRLYAMQEDLNYLIDNLK